MAMYYQNSSELIQADNNSNIQTLYLMNPNFIGYSNPTQPQSNMLFAASNPALAPHAPPQQDISSTACGVWGGGGDFNQQTPRGLSLSLSAHHHHQQQQQAGFDKSPISGDRDFPAANNNSSPPSSDAAIIIGSKYLKAAQELLDEVVNVGNYCTDKAKPVKHTTAAANKEPPSANKGGSRGGGDLTTTQRQEIQMKKAKLNNMLDEVEQRCRQYQQQMQMIVAAFEQAAGPGSARSYTQLALKTILKQFRCLKKAISAQIKALSKSLGEVEQGSEMSRLRFVDRHQNNAWRPQRGLPERAVSVLRAWLFQHFLHPYPKDSDKQMLAKQTGLTRSQVSNWFINARVRLWKPMVEEMYLQETNNLQPAASNAAPIIKPEPTAVEISPSIATASILNMEKNPKKPRNIMNNLDCLSMPNINSYHDFRQPANSTFSLSLALPPPHTLLSHFQPWPSELDNQVAPPFNQIIDFHNRKPFPPHLLPDFVA